jgi:serine/threonine protein kinase
MERIGRGSYANVWASHSFAFKLPHEWSAEYVHTVLREGLFLRTLALRSEGRPLLKGLCVKRNEFAGFAMDRAATNLYKYIRTQDATIKELLGLLCTVANNIQSIHSLGYVHCDIKLNNILVFDDHTGCLCDFGLVRPVGSSEVYDVCAPLYRPPELHELHRVQVTDQPFVETSVDIWSFCVCIYQCLWIHSSIRPFDLLQKYKYDEFPLTNRREERRVYLEQRFNELNFCADAKEPLFELLLHGFSWIPDERPNAKKVSELLHLAYAAISNGGLITQVVPHKEPADLRERDFEIIPLLPHGLAKSSLKDSLKELCRVTCKNLCQVLVVPMSSSILDPTLALFHIFSETISNQSPHTLASFAAMYVLYLQWPTSGFLESHILKTCSIPLSAYQACLYETMYVALQHNAWFLEIRSIHNHETNLDLK